eukprot:13850769-Alexandrium_andersonii.AAC.1
MAAIVSDSQPTKDPAVLPALRELFPKADQPLPPDCPDFNHLLGACAADYSIAAMASPSKLSAPGP